MKDEKSLVSIKNLSKTYRSTEAVKDISFVIDRGKITGFLGPNGAGKSSTIKCLLGLIKTDKDMASITVNQKKLKNMQDLRFYLNLGAMLESHSFFPELSAAQNLKILFYSEGIMVDENKMNELLNTVSLLKEKDNKVITFSKGMKQKLAFISCFLNNPDLLILDEPFNGLDPNTMIKISSFLKEYAAKGGTVFVSSHILGEMEELCDNLIILNEGQIVCQGELKQITSSKSLREIYLEATTQ